MISKRKRNPGALGWLASVLCGAVPGLFVYAVVHAQSMGEAGDFGMVQYGGGAINNPVLAADGSQSAPAYSFSGASNTGMWRTSGTNLGFSVNGALGLVVTSSALTIGNLYTLTSSGNGISVDGTFVSSRSTDLGWTVQSAANQACNTTCTSACSFGWDAGTTTIVDCSSALADKCVCAGSS